MGGQALSSSTPSSLFTDEEEGHTDNSKLLFKLFARIVAKSFYSGNLHDGEMVILVREPMNPYDPNAIKVTTISGCQVGYISAKSIYPNVARALSPIMDYKLKDGAGGILEAVSLVGRGNQYKSECRVNIIGLPEHKGAILAHLQSSNIAFLDLESSGGYNNYRNWDIHGSRETTEPTQLSHVSSVSPSLRLGETYRTLSASEVIRSMDLMWSEKNDEVIALEEKDISFREFEGVLLTELFKHQLVAVSWMKDRENIKSKELPHFYKKTEDGKYFHDITRHEYEIVPENIKGGILSDAMGLGKSLSILGLIVANPPPGYSYQRQIVDEGTPSIEGRHELQHKKIPELKQILKRLGTEDFKGKNKSALIDAILQAQASRKADQIIYPSKIPNDVIGSSSLPSLRQPTLIVCPLTVISAWHDQLTTHFVDGAIVYITYHGPDRSLHTAESFMNADIVLTTYDVLAYELHSEPSDSDSGKKMKHSRSPLEEVEWYRIVLDEAHVIRNMKSQRSKACFMLKSTFRWIISGSLLVNTVADLETHLRFLQLSPFNADHTLFKRYFTRPIKAGNSESLSQIRALMKTISIRREKNIIEQIKLSPKLEYHVEVHLSEKEQKAYDAISQAIQDFSRFNAGDDMSSKRVIESLANNSQSVLALITRLRQACLDLNLVPVDALIKILSVKKKGSTAVERLSSDEIKKLKDKLYSLFIQAGVTTCSGGADATGSRSELEEFEVTHDCAICFEPLVEKNASIFKKCLHTLCNACIDKIFKANANGRMITCPLCRANVRRLDCVSVSQFKVTMMSNAVVGSQDDRDPSNQLAPSKSSKTLKVLETLAHIKTKGEKTVIFSSFVSYLNILEKAIEAEGYVCARIDGSTSQLKRAREIKRFQTGFNVDVILCSVKACGTGLTLTAANHIFLTDLWWAPSIDLQAIDRVHRIGQKKEVSVYRFLCKNSVDEKIFELQKQKMNLQDMTQKPEGFEARLERAKDMAQLIE